ncbi:hypothetical protein J31TS4_47970 [Paenibacillus sp. J31TS4]|uniref:Mini-ribonuclease 3 n=1 Tax=Paenibacillus sp. J31TS4 TaxID=2807195 RepID=UPI001B075EF3|nr:Mini-ribonuclease 3 [Paenibacillus sp. J31TS4]GIP41517.1 hypothetical protein J31TS4_47970 [Paenibacillus sp. J31TS4]
MEEEGLLYAAPGKDPRLMQPLVLAYIGDAVYELMIRQYLIAQPNQRVHHLHQEATSYVSAKSQAKALDIWTPLLDEEELDIVRRGRNAKSGSAPRNTDIVIYRLATGFECLIGYLYCARRFGRLRELMDLILGKPLAGEASGAGPQHVAEPDPASDQPSEGD